MSAVPAAIDALLAAAQADAAIGAGGVQVVDGQPIQMEDDFLVIGWAPGGLAVRATGESASNSARRAETFDVACLISCWHGDTEMKPVRDRAYALLEAVRLMLAADPRLGSVVGRAQLGADLDLDQSQTSDQDGVMAGAMASIAFSVHCQTAG